MAEHLRLNKVHEIKSTVEAGEVNMTVVEFLKIKAALLTGRIYLLVYKHHEVLIGEVQDGEILVKKPGELTAQYLLEMRMFSPNGELYLWNQNGKINYRLRLDEQGELTNQYDEEHFIWGQKKDASGGSEPFWKRVPTPPKTFDNTVIEPNRGMCLTFPFPVTGNECPLKYRVRNYLEFDDDGQIRFYDARMITFLNTHGEELLP
ncbi:MAG: CRISPR-associated protein Csx19 [Candidatus Aminicenantes bacterium]|jgi:CRISPR-associated protein (TIGR03984 family)